MDHSQASQDLGHTLFHTSQWILLFGLCNGFRAVWLYIFIFTLLFLRRSLFWNGALLVFFLLFTIIANIALAADLSRSVSNLMPVALMGFFEVCRSASRGWSSVFIGALIFNFVMPTEHVVSKFTEQILNFPAQLAEYLNPPIEFTPKLYQVLGTIAEKPDNQVACFYFSEALLLDPNYDVAYVSRGRVLGELGLKADAENDFKKAISLNPDNYDAYLEWARLAPEGGPDIQGC